jgi:hypothetical protein
VQVIKVLFGKILGRLERITIVVPSHHPTAILPDKPYAFRRTSLAISQIQVRIITCNITQAGHVIAPELVGQCQHPFQARGLLMDIGYQAYFHLLSDYLNILQSLAHE